MILKCISSFYVRNENGSLSKRISMGSYWTYLGVENNMHKLQRIYKNNKLGNFAYISKSDVKRNFVLINQ